MKTTPPCTCTAPPCDGCPARTIAELTTSIAYHGDHACYPYRVMQNGLWIASVASYATGDQVLMSATLERIYVGVLERLTTPHACAGCGDPTIADLCPACQEWAGAPLDVDFAPVGWL